MGGAELWSEKTSPGESSRSDGAGVAGGGVRGMWGVGVVSESDCVIWMAGGSMEEEVGLGGLAEMGAQKRRLGVRFCRVGNGTLMSPSCWKTGLSWWDLPVLKESVWSDEGGELWWLSE